jgi:hypothetical protein
MPAGLERAVSAIVGLLVPSYPELDAPTRTAVGADVTDFVVSQIEAMPAFLRVPYTAALAVFSWLPLLRYGRRFWGLDAAAQAAYLSRWSDGRFGVPRNFIKLIRSCALLAYFDHARVREQLETQRHAAARQHECVA